MLFRSSVIPFLGALLILGFATRFMAIVAAILLVVYIAGIASVWARGSPSTAAASARAASWPPARSPATARTSRATPACSRWRCSWPGHRVHACRSITPSTDLTSTGTSSGYERNTIDEQEQEPAPERREPEGPRDSPEGTPAAAQHHLRLHRRRRPDRRRPDRLRDLPDAEAEAVRGAGPLDERPDRHRRRRHRQGEGRRCTSTTSAR